MASDALAAVHETIQRLWDIGAIGGLTDAQLLRHFLSGPAEVSEAAFAGLVERHGPAIAAGVRYFKAGQQTDGSWTDNDTGATTGRTSLVTLALVHEKARVSRSLEGSPLLSEARIRCRIMGPVRRK